MDVKIVSDHKPTNTEFREDRVWVLVDMENIVVKQPYIAWWYFISTTYIYVVFM